MEGNRPEDNLKREMNQYFNEVFDDLLLRERGYRTPKLHP